MTLNKPKIFQDIDTINTQLGESANYLLATGYGAKGDNFTDDYNALNNLFKGASADVLYDSTLNSNRIFRKSIEIPCGIYRIKSADLLANALSVRASNLVINGNGSTIVFDGFSGDCFFNNDYLLNITFRDITFVSIDDSMERILFNSVSNGGVQGYRFENCIFRGKWKYCFKLTGSNNNSEFIFDGCAMFGTWDSFLYGGDSTESGSNQFLNYWFNNCRYWSSSNWITLKLGGHINLHKCDVSGYAPTVDTYLFNLGIGTSGNTYGVQTFIDEGSRYELKTENAKVINCNWDLAQVLFKGCDFSSSAFLHGASEAVYRFVTTGSKQQIIFDDCRLLGKVSTYETAVNNANLFFRNCLFIGIDSIKNNFMRESPTYQQVRKIYIENCKLDTTPDILQNFVITNDDIGYVNLINTNVINRSSSGVLSTWTYPILQRTIIKNIYIIPDDTADGYTRNAIIYATVGNIVSASDQNIYVDATTYSKLKVGQNILINGVVFTIANTNRSTYRFGLTTSATGINIGDSIGLIVMQSGDFICNAAQKIIKSAETPCVVYNDLNILLTSSGGSTSFYGTIVVDFIS